MSRIAIAGKTFLYFCNFGYITKVRRWIHPLGVPRSSLLAIFLTAMTQPTTDYPIPPNHSPFPMPDLTAMTLQPSHPNTFLYSRLDPAPVLAFPLHHPEPPSFGPSGIALTEHDHDHPIPQPIMRDQTWDSTMSVPTPQIFPSDARVPNIEARRRTAAAYEHL